MTTASDRPIEAIGVTFQYGATPTLHAASLAVHKGEMLALAGPNGSGKTTLLKLLSGLLQPRTGEVRFDGQNIANLSHRERARRIAVVSQHIDPRLLFTVEAIVAMGRAPHTRLLASPSAEDRRVISEAMHVTEVAGFARRRFDELSGGEQQRVILAMALAQETDYLLLDEPTVHLDLHHQHELLELLDHLHRERGIGILAVMHDLNLASLYFERLALLNQGRIVADANPAAVLNRSDLLQIFRAPLRVITHPQTGASQVLLERRQEGQ